MYFDSKIIRVDQNIWKNDQDFMMSELPNNLVSHDQFSAVSNFI